MQCGCRLGRRSARACHRGQALCCRRLPRPGRQPRQGGRSSSRAVAARRWTAVAAGGRHRRAPRHPHAAECARTLRHRARARPDAHAAAAAHRSGRASSLRLPPAAPRRVAASPRAALAGTPRREGRRRGSAVAHTTWPAYCRSANSGSGYSTAPSGGCRSCSCGLCLCSGRVRPHSTYLTAWISWKNIWHRYATLST